MLKLQKIGLGIGLLLQLTSCQEIPVGTVPEVCNFQLCQELKLTSDELPIPLDLRTGRDVILKLNREIEPYEQFSAILKQGDYSVDLNVGKQKKQILVSIPRTVLGNFSPSSDPSHKIELIVHVKWRVETKDYPFEVEIVNPI